jgi:hypothetical protein
LSGSADVAQHGDLGLVAHQRRERFAESSKVRLTNPRDLRVAQRLPARLHLLKDRLVRRLDHHLSVEAPQREIDVSLAAATRSSRVSAKAGSGTARNAA